VIKFNATRTCSLDVWNIDLELVVILIGFAINVCASFFGMFSEFRFYKLTLVWVISFETEVIANCAGEFAVWRFGAKGRAKVEWVGWWTTKRT
jgi:hypothetical protein